MTLIPLLATLVVWHSYRGSEREALEASVQSYPGGVEVLALPHEVLGDKFEAAAPRGGGPDVIVFAHERAERWRAQKLLNGPGVPLAKKALALIRNLDMVPNAPRTIDELIAAANKTTHAAKGQFGLVYEVSSLFFHAPFLAAFGGSVDRLSTPQAAASLRFVRDRLLRTGVMPDESSGALATSLFNERRAAMVISGPWMLAEINPQLRVGVSPLPGASLVTVEMALVSRYAKNAAAAHALAQYLASPEIARLRARIGRQPVATAGVELDPVLAGFRDAADRGQVTPSDERMRATWQPAEVAIRKVMRGAALPEAALAEAERRIATTLKPLPKPARAWPYALACVALLGVLARRLFSKRRDLRPTRGWLYVAPATLVLLAFVGFPFVIGAAVSFFAYDQGAYRFVGVGNFVDVLGSSDFYGTLLVTVIWTVANVVLHVAIGVTLALLLRPAYVRGRAAWRLLFLLPWAVPNYITALIWKGMFHRQFGAVNALLAWMGCEPISFFARFSTAFAANLATNTWLGFPFMMVVTLGALQSVPRDLEEAAAVDGASRWQAFSRIVLPLLTPTLGSAVLLGSIWTFNMFNVIYLVSGGEPDGSTDILVSEAYRWAFQRNQRYGYAAAYAVLILLILLPMTRALHRKNKPLAT